MIWASSLNLFKANDASMTWSPVWFMYGVQSNHMDALGLVARLCATDWPSSKEVLYFFSISVHSLSVMMPLSTKDA